MTKSRCETCGQWFEDDEIDGHLNTHLDEPAEPASEPTEMKCPDCQTGMEAYYSVPFRVGRGDIATRLLFGVWAELDREPVLMDLYVCPQCGRILQYANKATRDRLRRSAPHKP